MIALLVVLAAIACYCLGALYSIKRELFWRIEWIKLEHDLARLENREPRNIDDYYKRFNNNSTS